MRIVWMGLLAALVMMVGVANADIITFSGAISDDNGPGAEVFDATIDWTYLELDQILCVTIYNQTVSPDAYTIAVLGFNTSDNVTGVALITDPLSAYYNSAFPDATSGGAISNGGFGTFDWSLDLAGGNAGLDNGLSTTFYFQATGDFLSEDDFFAPVTVSPNGEGVAIIHFARGLEDDSAWGIPITGDDPPPITVIPEPASVALFGLGLVAIMLRRRKG